MGIPQTLDNWLQPHEGVAGTERPDDPVLTLAPAAKKVLATIVSGMWGATIWGSPAPRIRELGDRMKNPQPGDYVIVQDITTGWMSRREDADDYFLKGVGIFLGDRQEWWQTDEQWAADKAEDGIMTDADRTTDHAWYVQYLPDARSVCRWVNCTLLAFPSRPAEWR